MYPWLQESRGSGLPSIAKATTSLSTTQHSHGSAGQSLANQVTAELPAIASATKPREPSVQQTPSRPSIDPDRDSILQFAPQSVAKMSQRRNEVAGPNDQPHQLYHSQLSQILSQHQAENSAFIGSQAQVIEHQLQSPDEEFQFGACQPFGAGMQKGAAIRQTLFQTVHEEEDRSGARLASAGATEDHEMHQDPMSSLSNLYM